MGIYDRDYYRREGRNILGSFVDNGTVCKWLIGINVGCFVIQFLTTPTGNQPIEEGSPFGFFADWLILDGRVLHGEIWRLLTYAFLHSPFAPMHIIFNMLFLLWFGRDVEDLYGPREFLVFYLVSAVVGGLLYVLAPFAGFGRLAPCMGASGAVTAVMVLCACHYPTRIILFMMVIPIPIWLFVVFQVAQDTFAFFGRAATSTAVAVHLGGAAFAALYFYRHWRLTPFLPNVSAWRRRRTQPRLRVYREIEDERPAPVGVTSAAPPARERPDDEQLEAKMDAVLEKISRVGKENLNDSDREVLRLAAERIKRRRG
jgi:membrane associated rhomboid family serine protease